ncbi:class F sortase [Pseudonocardia sp. McavD-2-B]|nr:class F sortase [Pseudonocardia sp. McavD-2-B]
MLVGREDGSTARFEVYRVDVVDKGAFPTQAVYGDTSGPDLAGPAVAVAAPASVEVPAIDARSSLVETDLNDDGSVEVPPVEQPEQASWYRQSPKPGQPGPAILLGHVNGAGRPGVFAELAAVEAGDDVLVGREDGSTARFEVYRVDVVDKGAFPTQAVYGDTSGPELRLVSCGGEFVGGELGYSDNVIAYAREVIE